MIPERIITRAPSAELRADQTDQDSLPPYDVLDAHPRGLRRAGPEPGRDRRAWAIAPSDVRKVVRLIKVNEYKRRQAAVGIRITPRGFGKDWRYPITSAWNEWESVGAPDALSAARTARASCKLASRRAPAQHGGRA